MKKVYSKKQLALLIIAANDSIFIPVETLTEDLDTIYKIRKIAKKIINEKEYDIKLLKNLFITASNVFGDNVISLFNIILSDEEIVIIEKTLKEY